MGFLLSRRKSRNPILMYVIPINASEENLIGDEFRVSEKDLLTSTSINEGVSGSLKYYYELVYRDDLLARGECLYRKKLFFGEFKRRNAFYRKV